MPNFNDPFFPIIMLNPIEFCIFYILYCMVNCPYQYDLRHTALHLCNKMMRQESFSIAYKQKIKRFFHSITFISFM